MTCQGTGSTGIKTANWLFENWAKTGRRVVPTVYSPANIEQLVAAVLDAEREGGSVKAIGSGWSYSGVAVDDSTTHVINTALLTGVLSGRAASTPPV
jgi:FAD/FMN-containing dehydrogenase